MLLFRIIYGVTFSLVELFIVSRPGTKYLFFIQHELDDADL